MKQKLLFLLLALAPWILQAETIADRDSAKHEVRIGWGDMITETGIHYSTLNTPNYRYTGHIFAEYDYRINRWLAIGGQFDYQQLWWDVAWKDGHKLPEVEKNHTYYNIAIMPAVQFTYFHHPWVNIYSSIYLGLNINGGTDESYNGRKVELATAFGATLVGISVGHKGWFGNLEIGGLSALNNPHEVYMLCSRIFTLSVGHRF